MQNTALITKLVKSKNPSIQYKTKVYLLNEDTKSKEIEDIKRKIKISEMANKLLSLRDKTGRISTNPYKKWQGPHWTLYCLAQIEYPQGDNSLLPLRDQVYEWLLSEEHLKYPRSLLIEGQENRFRRCASQEGNAIWYSIKLGIEDERTAILVDRLIKWQWPDGGWNCDKNIEARTSSFIESLIPLRALFLYGKKNNYTKAIESGNKTAEFILKRKLLKRLTNGKIIHQDFLKIHYPINFYDILFALKVMVEIGKINDIRCKDALELLLSKQLPNGGFPLEQKNCKTTNIIETRGSFVHWGNSGKRQMNEFITIDALYVLMNANMLKIVS